MKAAFSEKLQNFLNDEVCEGAHRRMVSEAMIMHDGGGGRRFLLSCAHCEKKFELVFTPVTKK